MKETETYRCQSTISVGIDTVFQFLCRRSELCSSQIPSSMVSPVQVITLSFVMNSLSPTAVQVRFWTSSSDTEMVAFWLILGMFQAACIHVFWTDTRINSYHRNVSFKTFKHLLELSSSNPLATMCPPSNFTLMIHSRASDESTTNLFTGFLYFLRVPICSTRPMVPVPALGFNPWTW